MKTIDLYILRHGVAEEPKSSSAESDSQRRLTPDGIKKMRRGAKGIKKSGITFDVILSSPYLRAKETAEIVAEILGLENRLKISPALASNGNPKQLIDEIKHAHSKCKQILLTGHEPYLSKLISLLISGDTGISLTLKKGGLCKLSTTHLRYRRCATLEWLLTASQAGSLK